MGIENKRRFSHCPSWLKLYTNWNMQNIWIEQLLHLLVLCYSNIIIVLKMKEKKRLTVTKWLNVKIKRISYLWSLPSHDFLQLLKTSSVIIEGNWSWSFSSIQFGGNNKFWEWTGNRTISRSYKIDKASDSCF